MPYRHDIPTDVVKDVATQRRPKRDVIRSADDIEWEVVYAEPSDKTEEIYMDVMRYLYRFGERKGLFTETKEDQSQTTQREMVAASQHTAHISSPFFHVHA